MRRLHRSQMNRMIAGICGGIGETYRLDPTLVRLAVVFFGLITGVFPFILFYLVAWIIIPLR